MALTNEEIARYQEWEKRKITTPTFRLSPLEKPDMSPFLIHMTGKGSLISILKGEGADRQIKGVGFLKSSIPKYGSEKVYNSPVVCFTETPLFALDFFRFRSQARWHDNQQYGIGFSKEKLILHRNVRPVICLDTKTNSKLLDLCNKAEGGDRRFSDDDLEHNETVNLLKSLKPLLFPMLEQTEKQGFMWEREWRSPSPDGFQFAHILIEIICCPKEERDEILEILGAAAEKIKFVESWKEYDDLTYFLKDQEKMKELPTPESVYQINDIAELRKMFKENAEVMQAIINYRNIFKGPLDGQADKKANELADRLWEYHQAILEQLTGLEYYQSAEFQEIYEAWERDMRYEE